MKNILIILFLLIFLMPISSDAELVIGNRKRLLPIGDSITWGTGDTIGNTMGYRDHLQDRVGKEFVVVGTKKRPQSAAGYATNNSAYPSIDTEQTEDMLLTELQNTMTNAPEGSVVLLHIATNDAGRIVDSVSGYTRQGTIDNVEDILDIIRVFDTSLTVYVADLGPSGDVNDNAEMVAINSEVRSMINTYKITYPNFKIHEVSMNTMYSNDTYSLCSGDAIANCYDDNIHPNDIGYRSMSNQWSDCLEDLSSTNCDIILPLSNYLIADYTLEENSASTAVDNTEGTASLDCTATTNTNNLSIIGKLNNAFNFVGTNSERLDCGASSLLKPSGNFSVEFWMRTSTTGTTRRILGNRGTGTNIGFEFVQMNTNIVRLFVDNGGTVIDVVGTTTITDGNWHHIILNKSGDTVSLYIDGSSEGTPNDITGDVGTGAGNFYIGWTDAGTTYYDGDIDNVRLFSRTLTSAEIAFLYNSGTGTEAED